MNPNQHKAVENGLQAARSLIADSGLASHRKALECVANGLRAAQSHLAFVPRTTIAGLVIDIEARIDKFERALDEQFKPALAKAVGEVVERFLGDNLANCVEVASE